jgi:hypothetical protein
MPYRRFLRVLMALGEQTSREADARPAHRGAQQWTQAEMDAMKARHADRLRKDAP